MTYRPSGRSPSARVGASALMVPSARRAGEPSRGVITAVAVYDVDAPAEPFSVSVTPLVVE